MTKNVTVINTRYGQYFEVGIPITEELLKLKEFCGFSSLEKAAFEALKKKSA